MKSSFLAFLIIIISTNLVYGQNQLEADSICFNKNIIDYSIDSNGAIFLSFEGGSITKYSAELDSTYTYSPTKVGDTKLLESGSGLVIFTFYDFFQEYVLIDRFLARPTRTKISNTTLDYIDLATQSSDNNLWVVENSGFRLIKFNASLNLIEFETALNTVIDSPNSNFTFIKEYQNRVFLVDENSGIYVFDNLGNFSKFIPAITKKCTFENNNIIYLENKEVVITDLYTQKESRTRIKHQRIIGVMKHKNNTYYVSTTCLFRSN